MIKDACFIIPVYNEADVVKGVIDTVGKECKYIVCIDDGSSDTSSEELSKTKAIVLKHVINLGQGAALQTGIDYATRHLDVEYFVTFDSDGQHRLSDAINMMSIAKKGRFDVVLGSRFLNNKTRMPLTKRIVLKMGILFTNTTSKIKLTDTHNGLRVFNRKFAKNVKLQSQDMSHANELIDLIVASKVKWCEAPVTIDYTEHSMSKGQSVFNSINIAFDTLLKKGL